MVAFDSRDASASQGVTRDYMDQLLKRLESLGVAAKTADMPQSPNSPVSPDWQSMIAVGLAFGLICGVLVKLLQRRSPAPS
jgi:uncharacterized protein involved in exopolysaccharide biosynthesis